MTKWTEVPAGVITAAQQRFWKELGDDAGWVATAMAGNPTHLAAIVAAARNTVATVSVLKPAIKTVLTLVNNKVVYEEIADFDPHTFFKPTEELGVSASFLENILPRAKGVGKLPTVNGKAFDLTKDAEDKFIVLGLPKGHTFRVSGMLARIAKKIEAQPDGKEGDLLNNGYDNLFYGVRGFVIRVVRHNGNHQWYVDARRLGHPYSIKGTRVFSHS